MFLESHIFADKSAITITNFLILYFVGFKFVSKTTLLWNWLKNTMLNLPKRVGTFVFAKKEKIN